MNQQFTDESQARLLGQISAAIVKQRRENNEVWLHQSGYLFKIESVLFIISGIVNFLFYVVYLFARLLELQDALLNVSDTSNYRTALSEMRSSIFLTAFSLTVLIAAFIFLKLRKYVPFSICCIVSALPMIIHFYQAMQKSIESTNWSTYIFRHALPLGIMLLCGIYILITALLEKSEIKRLYHQTVQKIFDTYSTSDEITTQEQWDKYLAEYFEGNPEIKVKRSVKHRRQKNNYPPA